MPPVKTSTPDSSPRTLAAVLASDPRFPRQRMASGTTLLPHSLEHGVLVVLDGALAVEVSRDGADAQILEVIGPGSGMLSGRQLATARRATFLCALVPTTVVILSEREFGRVLESDVLLACSLANQLCERAAEMQERLSARNAQDAHLRMGHCLLYLHDKLGLACPVGPGTRIPISQASIAAVAGLARQTANRVLRDLQTLGVIHLEREAVCVLCRSGLEHLASGGPLPHAWRAAGNCQFVHPGTSLACRSLRPVPLARVSPKLRRFVDR